MLGIVTLVVWNRRIFQERSLAAGPAHAEDLPVPA